MLTNNWPGMWKEINSQLGVFLNIMNITGPSVYNGRTWFTLLHMAEAPHRTLNLLQHPSPPPVQTREFTCAFEKYSNLVGRLAVTHGLFVTVDVSHCWCCDVGEATRKTQLTSYTESLPASCHWHCVHTQQQQQQIADTTWWYDHTMITLPANLVA